MMFWVVVLVGVLLVLTGSKILSLAYSPVAISQRLVSGRVPQSAYDRLLKRKVGSAPAPAHFHDGSRKALAPARDGTAVAWLRIAGDGDNRRHPISGAPVTIGFTPDCDVIVPHTGAHTSGRVRVWQRSGRFMLHNISRAGYVSVRGRSVSWAVLEHGDVIEIGDGRVLFELAKLAPVRGASSF